MTDAAFPRSASSFVCAAVKGVCSAGENLVGELRVVDGACHRDRPDQSRESQDRFVSLGVGLGWSDQADEPVDVPPYLPAVGVARSGTASRDGSRGAAVGEASITDQPESLRGIRSQCGSEMSTRYFDGSPVDPRST
jgi:hypothetical protein